MQQFKKLPEFLPRLVQSLLLVQIEDSLHRRFSATRCSVISFPSQLFRGNEENVAAPSGFTTLSGLRRAARAQKEIRGRVPAILSIPLALPPAEQKVTHASLCGQKRHQQRSANLISDYEHRERRDTSKKPMIYLAGVPAGPGISFRGRERGQLFDCNCRDAAQLRAYV